MVVFKKKSVFIVSILLITAITFIFCFSAISNLGVGEASSSNIKIVLDAGHGGIDGGSVGSRTGVKESEINLKIVKKLEKYLLDSGFSVVLTRSSEGGLYGLATSNRKKKDMQKRSQIINNAKPDLVISVHQNTYTLSSRFGAQVFYNSLNDNSKVLANFVQSSFNEMKEARRQCSALSADYFLLNCSSYPTIIAECGFLSNSEDEALLITDEYQDSLAYAIYKGVILYLSETTLIKN